MSVNIVVQSGAVHNLALRYGDDGKPECRFTLTQEENGFTLYLPCCALGAAAEKVADQLTDGDHIVITSGKLTYRKRSTQKFGEVSRLEVLVWSVDRLSESPQDDSDGGGPVSQEGDREIVDSEPAQAPSIFDAPKARKPRYAKWKPANAN